MKTIRIAALALLAVPLAVAPAHASTVGPTGSIQAAVDAAAPGDTIVVRGTHREKSAIRGGVVVAAEPGGVPAERNVVTGNVIVGNDPDVVWDGAGTGNVFRGNLCPACE
jgi:nitrous oxidase accessory protein NosD